MRTEMSETKCKHCSDEKSKHPTLLVNGAGLLVCVPKAGLTTFEPAEPTPAPFKVGDWVKCDCDLHRAFQWTGRDNDPDVRAVTRYRLATPAEIRAVTHFVPKLHMILRRKSVGHEAEAWKVEGVGAGRTKLHALNNIQASWTRDEDDFAHADWTILDSFTVQGVK